MRTTSAALITAFSIIAATCWAADTPYGVNAGLAADLAVEIHDSPDPVPTGSVLTYAVSITNFGPSTGTNLIFEFLVPEHLVIESAGFAGCTVTDTSVACSFPTIAVDQTFNGDITGIAGTAGSTIIAAAQVSSDEFDFVEENNIATALTLISDPVDTDEDGVHDAMDNCTEAANAEQRDTDLDGIGNACDPDFDQNCIVNFNDLTIMKAFFFIPGNFDTDLNGDGFTNFSDLSIMQSLFFLPPGPSASGSLCNQ